MAIAYITAPYSDKATKKGVRPYGKIEDRDYMKFLQNIKRIVADFGYHVILPHEHSYDWGDSNYNPAYLIRRAFEFVKSSELVIAYPERSKGVNILIGWASLLNKKIIILEHETEDTSIVYLGLKGIADVKIIKFKDLQDMEEKLRKELELINSSSRNEIRER